MYSPVNQHIIDSSIARTAVNSNGMSTTRSHELHTGHISCSVTDIDHVSEGNTAHIMWGMFIEPIIFRYVKNTFVYAQDYAARR